MEPATFLEALDRFLGTLPPGLHYATEVRNPAILGSCYLNILSTHHVSHACNHLDAHVDPHATIFRATSPARADIYAPHVVIRLLTPLGLVHEKAVERYAPYDRIIAAQPRMRQDTTELVQPSGAQGKSAYVLVNNRAEGCSPLTIHSLVAGLKN